MTSTTPQSNRPCQDSKIILKKIDHFDDPNDNISGVYDNAKGVFTLKGTDSLANYRTALQSVTYNNISKSPTTDQRSISWQVDDGTESSTAINSTVKINAINNPPEFGNIDKEKDFNEGKDPVVLTASLSLSDVDNVRIESATVRISDNHLQEDRLGFDDDPNDDISGGMTAKRILHRWVRQHRELQSSSSISHVQQHIKTQQLTNTISRS